MIKPSSSRFVTEEDTDQLEKNDFDNGINQTIARQNIALTGKNYASHGKFV